MIRIVTPANYDSHMRELREMYAQRKTEYHDQLKWNVSFQSGFETDEYDKRSPIYLIAMDSRCIKVWGSVRLHPTLGPSPLKENFPELVWHPSHSYIWESSRLCYGYKSTAHFMNPLQRNIAVELLDAQLRIGWEAGADVIVCVIDLRVERQLNAIGRGGERVGGPKRHGINYVVAMAWRTAPPSTGRLHQSG